MHAILAKGVYGDSGPPTAMTMQLPSLGGHAASSKAKKTGGKHEAFSRTENIDNFIFVKRRKYGRTRAMLAIQLALPVEIQNATHTL